MLLHMLYLYTQIIQKKTGRISILWVEYSNIVQFSSHMQNQLAALTICVSVYACGVWVCFKTD